MNNLFLNIFAGVLSGVITSGLLFLSFILKEKIFNPWWENRLYRGVVLEGTWIGQKIAHYKSLNDRRIVHDELNIQIDLQQNGYCLKGIFTAESITADKEGKDSYKNIYKVKGHIHDNYAVFEYHPMSRKRTGLGIFLMEVKNGGKRMIGDITFLEEGDMEIVTLEDAILNRVGTD